MNGTESGLVNNGWYGKFHVSTALLPGGARRVWNMLMVYVYAKLEMVLWHSLHFARWNQWPLLRRSQPNMYQRFLPSSISRAAAQGYAGARWGKMTDPTGRSAPGEINSLLIWQQPPVSENTNPNATVNPAFEIAYWRFGLDIAIEWKQRQGLEAPEEWTTVRDRLAPLPLTPGGETFAVYEGIPNMWQNTTVQDHPAMAGVFGLLPPPSSGAPLNMTVVQNTHDKIVELWDIEDCWGWDFPMLAMNSLRLGRLDQAIAYLLHPLFEFDDAGYPIGGVRVATPYFPASGGFLLAMAMLAGGWDGSEGPHFPQEWNVKVEGFIPGL
jgi:hypothetical protein